MKIEDIESLIEKVDNILEQNNELTGELTDIRMMLIEEKSEIENG